MSRGGESTQQFGLDAHLFRLGWGDWKRIQEATDCGPFEMMGRLGIAMAAMANGLNTMDGLLMAASCKLGPQDARMVCYHGLIGGGMERDAAARLVNQVMGDLPAANLDTAHAIVVASLYGAKDETPGEPVAAEVETKGRRRSKTARSASPASTPPAP